MKQVMYKCAHCPHETDKCVKLVFDECVECYDEEPDF